MDTLYLSSMEYQSLQTLAKCSGLPDSGLALQHVIHDPFALPLPQTQIKTRVPNHTQHIVVHNPSQCTVSKL